MTLGFGVKMQAMKQDKMKHTWVTLRKAERRDF
jgi:hypothetical protein